MLYKRKKGDPYESKLHNWEIEFVDAIFLDPRLKTRFFKIMNAFAAAPDKST